VQSKLETAFLSTRHMSAAAANTPDVPRLPAGITTPFPEKEMRGNPPTDRPAAHQAHPVSTAICFPLLTADTLSSSHVGFVKLLFAQKKKRPIGG
jgi:hypothetical protein